MSIWIWILLGIVGIFILWLIFVTVWFMTVVGGFFDGMSRGWTKAARDYEKRKRWVK